MSAFKPKGEFTRSTRVRALVLIGCALGIGSSMAHAARAPDVPSKTVKYSDLNLATDEGALELYSRIATAARAVCPDPDLRDLRTFANSERCQSEAIARAVHDVHSPRLAAMYNTRTNHG
jgi:UrcA family protein